MSSNKNSQITDEKLNAKNKALKRIGGEPLNSYMVIEFGYTELIFPFEEGLKVVEAMKHAKSFSSNYGRAPKISPLRKHEIRILTEAEVLAIHTAELLGIEDKDEWSDLYDEISKTHPYS